MDTPPIAGFITRKEASDKCKRAERTLQRYWSRAVELKNKDVLAHLKMRTEDGDIIEGTDVTKSLIERLRKQRKNPTWFVEAEWVEKEYGPRLDQKLEAKVPERGRGERPTPSPNIPNRSNTDDIVVLYKEQIEQLQADKQDLRDELKIKNKQIEQASERDRETHVLMRDLHELLRDMQHRLPSPTASVPSTSPSDATLVMDSRVPSDEPTASARPARATTKKQSRSAKQRNQKEAAEKPSLLHRDIREFLPFRRR